MQTSKNIFGLLEMAAVLGLAGVLMVCAGCGDASSSGEAPDQQETSVSDLGGDTGDTTSSADTDVGTVAIGATCAADGECVSGQCRVFGARSICTQACASTCEGGLTCYDGVCMPPDYCDTAAQTGPGCDLSPCSSCAPEATCVDAGAPTERGECSSGFSGNGSSCSDIDECGAGRVRGLL